MKLRMQLVKFHSPELAKANADGHGIVPDGFDLKIAVDAKFLCTVLLLGLCGADLSARQWATKCHTPTVMEQQYQQDRRSQ